MEWIREDLFKRSIPPEEVAAIFVEPIQGEGGYIPIPPDVTGHELLRLTMKAAAELYFENFDRIVRGEIVPTPQHCEALFCPRIEPQYRINWGVPIENILRRVADHVRLMENVSADQITEFFKWVSQSVSTASKSAQMAAGDQEAVAELSAPPEGIKIVI